ncbi:MAG TPA: 50S ribosomal protein L18 [Candidatus Paceibacterota bacterium]|jgi:large subunit ribosomal protein L18|nr:50S ribosomal protein L18 [Candidatus Paceibacterota bacterium]HOX90932.1 50S ribosomal protein L18 [Candidatus Paceibacterota bacterium]HPC12505.1 50S ribosomal protein L18 [Candidatus Paceibacterota bacterium]HPI66544.1 50S ribosomal protein L18 [Candidatus Paceibacterota bacterium]HQC46036.1 50S ribosomal protein L18 [Candidatus Paceibacterota bacterium]
MANKKIEKRIRLKAKIRAKIRGTKDRPRLSVFRSNNFIYAQMIDDENRKTLVSASDVKKDKGSKADRAKLVGQEIAKASLDKKIKKCIFDRNGFKYTGRIKALADAAREAGLDF